MFLLYGFTLYGQNIQIWPEINGLVEFSISSLYSKEWYELNYSSEKKYYVDDHGNVTIRKEEEMNEYRACPKTN
jgi:hypothetical protein